MKNRIAWGISAMLLAIIVGCGPTVYLSEDAKALSYEHKTLAIVPPVVIIKKAKDISGEALIEMQRSESINFQSEIYKAILKRKSRGDIKANIQDYQTTNALLERAGYPETTLTSSEICEALGVDGLITSNFSMDKPMSTGGAIVSTIFLGAGGATNEVTTSLQVYDCPSEKMIFNYDWRASGGLGSSPEDLIENLMKNASKKLPHYKNEG
jgi:hypothetical protein